MKWNYRNNILGIVFNVLGQVLLVQYSSSWSRSFPKWWLEKKESFPDGIQREIYEELWIEKKLLRYHFVYRERYKKRFTQAEIDRKIAHKWEYFIWKIENICVLSYIWDWSDIDTLVSAELAQHRWVSLSELNEYIRDAVLLRIIDISFLSNFITKIDFH